MIRSKAKEYPWRYVTENKKTRRDEDYSPCFETQEDAEKWHNKHGIFLEKTFNRVLKLVNKKDIEVQKRKERYDKANKGRIYK